MRAHTKLYNEADVGTRRLLFCTEVRGGRARSATEREELASRRSEAEPPEALYEKQPTV